MITSCFLHWLLKTKCVIAHWKFITHTYSIETGTSVLLILVVVIGLKGLLSGLPVMPKNLFSFCVACLSRKDTLGSLFHRCLLFMSVVVCLSWKGLTFGSIFHMLLMDFNQSWVIDATWEPSFVDDVKGHISRSNVIWGQVVRKAENVKMTSFEKLKSDLNQTWFIDIIWKLS